MAIKDEIRDFLLSRRARITPEVAGLPGHGPRRALFLPLFPPGGEPLNQARFLFLDETSRDFFPDWELLAHDAVAVLRAEAGRDPDLRRRRTGVKRFHHPVVGPVTVTFEKMALVADPDLRITAGLAEPGSESETALRLLASWAASTRTEGRA